MGVKAAIAFLNGNGAGPNSLSPPGKRPTVPKSNTSNWTTQRTIADKIKNNASTNINPSSSTPSNPTKTTTASTTTVTATALPTSMSSRAVIDMLVEELTAQYQEMLDKDDSSKQIIAKLESDVEVYACDSTKVRDYEIRVEYLAQKLEQVSEEKEQLEQELSIYKDRHGALATPVSPAFGPDVFGGKPTMIEAAPPATQQKSNTNQHNEITINNDTIEKQHQQKQQQLEDIYFDEILDAYEGRRSMDNDDIIQQQEYHEQMMAQMLAEYDQGMKMAMEAYVADLEKQRLENKTLQSMVKKQDELIKKLEIQSSSCHPSDDDGPSHPSNNSTKEDQQRLVQQQSRISPPSVRSSIDVLAEMARNDSALGSALGPIHQHHHQRDTGRNTPPPFAPPKTPLPPLPASEHSNTSINNDSMISYSRSSTSSATWSSDDQQHQHQYQEHPLSAMPAGLPPKHNSIENHRADSNALVGGGRDTFDTEAANTSTTSGSFWDGLKTKF